MEPRLFSHGDDEQDVGADEDVSSFNGATTFQPWRRFIGTDGLLREKVVSMEPRLFSHGDIENLLAGMDSNR